MGRKDNLALLEQRGTQLFEQTVAAALALTNMASTV